MTDTKPYSIMIFVVGVSPNGKATDSDSVISRFESLYPSYKLERASVICESRSWCFFSAEFFCFQKKTCYIDLRSVCLLCLEFSDIYAKHSHIPRKEAVPIVNFSQKYSALLKQHGIRNDFIWNWEKRECNIWQIEQFFSDLLQHIQKIRLFLAVETIVQRGCFKV